MSTLPEICKEDQQFRHYSLQHRVIAWISHALFDHVTYTVRHGLIRGMRRRGGLGWIPSPNSRSVATPEEQFWRNQDLRGCVVYDVGAFQGIFTMFFASRCAQVISYEPNSRNYARLVENIRLNGLNNVIVRKLGLDSKADIVELVFMPLMPGGGSVDKKTIAQRKRSHTTVVGEQIQITTLDQDIAQAGLPPPEFVKIDVEGLELAVLKGGARTLAAYHPALFLEMHGETLREKKRKVTEIVDWLTQAGYKNVVHVETQTITPSNAMVAVEGHLFCAPSR
jgi:FkbM family methyltransferase